MEKKFKVGILRENRISPDQRVALPPQQCVEALRRFPNIEFVIQPSEIRAYSNEEYTNLGFTLQENLEDCDILIGVKEVDDNFMIPNKSYLFFSHTAKKQQHNRKILQGAIKKNLTLIDYEFLTDKQGIRLIAFGRWAGIIGSYNALIAYGKRNNLYDLKRAYLCFDMTEFYGEVSKVKLPPIKILISGGGRVSHGAMEVLDFLKIKKVTPHQFLSQTFNTPVYSQIDPWHYLKRKDNEAFDWTHFSKHPNEYESIFEPFAKVTDIYLPCHFWDPRSPKLVTKAMMKSPDFKIKVIADISCDVNGSVESTTRTTSIADPFFGYNPMTENEGAAFHEGNITVMSVDNLPGEASRSASVDFGKTLIGKILPSLFEEDKEEIIQRATIVKNGKLTPQFAYLQNFADEKE